MFEDIFKKAVLEDRMEHVLRISNVILWISIVFVSYNIFFGQLNLIPLSDVHEIYKFLISGSYVEYIEWLFVIIILYYAAKLFLFRYLLNYKYLVMLFYIITPSRIGVPLQAILYKKTGAKKSHKRKAKIYADKINAKRNGEFLEMSEGVIGILLKIIILSILKFRQTDHSYFSICVMIITFLSILIIEYAIIKARGENMFCEYIRKLKI